MIGKGNIYAALHFFFILFQLILPHLCHCDMIEIAKFLMRLYIMRGVVVYVDEVRESCPNNSCGE